MFRDNKDKKIWEKIVNSTVNNKDILPLIFYRPFKISEHYIKHHFPEMELRDYIDKFWFADKYFY